MKIQIRADGFVFDVEAPDDNVLKALEKERKDSEEILSDAETKKTEAEARADAAEDKVSKLETELKEFRAEQDKRDRAVLIEKAGTLGKIEILDSDKPEDIRRKALETRGIKLDGKSDEYIRFRFEHELEIPVEETPVENLRQDKAREKNNAKPLSIDSMARGWR